MAESMLETGRDPNIERGGTGKGKVININTDD